jgi:hypothetical protein
MTAPAPDVPFARARENQVLSSCPGVAFIVESFLNMNEAPRATLRWPLVLEKNLRKTTYRLTCYLPRMGVEMAKPMVKSSFQLKQSSAWPRSATRCVVLRRARSTDCQLK